MEWKKYTIKTTTEAVDLVSNLLNEIGIEGIEIVDNVPLSEEDRQKMFIDIIPMLPPDDGTASIYFYLDGEISEEKEAEYLRQINEGLIELSGYMSNDNIVSQLMSNDTTMSQLMNIGEGIISTCITDDNDWMDNWKKFFKPFRVGDSIIIKPTWEEYQDSREGDVIIDIDPGRAFGTGSHETTKLCILAIKKYLKNGDYVLDLGSGSGILSIAAMKLGAKYVAGTDIDMEAVKISRENAALNHFDQGKMDFYNLNIISKKEDRDFIKEKFPEGFELITANILADIIIPLSDIVSEFMKKDSFFISSGIIDSKAEEVKRALIHNGFHIIETMVMGEWVSYVAILNKI